MFPEVIKTLFIEQFFGWRKREVVWLVFCLSSILALSLHWGDTVLGIVAATTGMLYTILAGKGKPLCFVFGLVNTPIYAYIAFGAGYYGDFALNIYYFVMMFPGIVFWLKNKSSSPEESIKRVRLSAKERLKLCALCVVGVVLLWIILLFLYGSRPFCDSVTNTLSIAAMVLTVRRAIEQWVLWIIVDIVEVFMWWYAWRDGSGTISVLLMWLLFLINGVYLLYLWKREKYTAVD